MIYVQAKMEIDPRAAKALLDEFAEWTELDIEENAVAEFLKHLDSDPDEHARPTIRRQID